MFKQEESFELLTRDNLHRLVDELSDDEVRAAERYLRYLRDLSRDPVARAFANAPLDDEELTLEDLAAIEAGKAELDRGESVSLDIAIRQIDRAS